MIYVTEKYDSFFEKLKDNLDFFIWVSLFSIFLLVLGVFSGFFFNWVLGSIIIAFAAFYLFYLWVKMFRINYKFSFTDYGIRGDRVFLANKFKKNSGYGEADEFYLVYSDIDSYKILKNNTLQIKNKSKGLFDDLNFKFSNISDENLELVISTFEKFGIMRVQ